MNKNGLWQALTQRELLLITIFLFITDVVIGAVASTMSLFAQGLGASLTLIGVLVAVLGLARFSLSIVIGNISDRHGRKMLLLVGMALMGTAAILYAGTTDPIALVPINVVFGAGFVTCLTLGLAYVGDITTTTHRSISYGAVSTAMGGGFAIGALVGGIVATRLGFSALYLGTAIVAAVGCLVIWRGLSSDVHAATTVQSGSFFRQVRLLMTRPIIVAICIGSLLSNLIFGGLILTFFPIYAVGLGLTLAVIGSMLATRTLASTVARLPGGALGTIVPGQLIMLGTLTVGAVVSFALVQVREPVVLTLLLVGEGVAYGLFLATSQASVSTHAPASRGAALGAFMAAAAVGDSFVPLLLGPLADKLGIRSVFYIVGTMVVLGILVIIWVLTQQRRISLPDHRI